MSARPVRDPRVRPDGRCAVCRKPRQKWHKGLSYVSRAQFEMDPFCSTECARSYYASAPG
jgi:hypothetical protein